MQTRSGDLTPYSIRHNVKPKTALPDEHMQHLLHLAETVKDDYGRMDLSSMWRPYGRYVSQSTASMPLDPDVEIASCNCYMLSGFILCVFTTDCRENESNYHAAVE